MSGVKKYGLALAVILAAGGCMLPFSQAQTRVLSNVLRLDEGSGAFLGIQMKNVTAENMNEYKLNSERGAVVSSVVKGSPAEAAKIQEGDVILEFGGQAVWSSMQLSRLVRETPVGRRVDLVVSRDGKRMTLNAKLEERTPESASARTQEMPPREFNWNELGPRSFLFRTPDRTEPSRPGPAAGKPRLGVTLQPLSEQLGEFLGVPDRKGALVASVLEGSPSAGKLKAGDVIVGVDGKTVEDADALIRMIGDKPSGTVSLKLIRERKEITVQVTLQGGDEKGYRL